jgi:segregation and condensation protein B
MREAVEAILFAAGRYVEVDQIAKLLQTDLRTTKKALSELKELYDSREGSALHVVQENNSWKLQVKDQYLEYAAKLAADTEIAKTVLETLAVVAWKNGISQAELIKIRGPAAYEHIGELVEKGFITKTPEGRSFKLVLQQKFFDYFDVTGREDVKQLFAPIEAEKAAAQAEIDEKQAAYDARIRASQEAMERGSTRVLLDGTNIRPSAQNTFVSQEVSVSDAPPKPADFISEAKAAVEELRAKQETKEGNNKQTSTGPPIPPEIVAVEEAVKEFGTELKELKRELHHEKKTMEHHKKTKQSSATVILPDSLQKK